MAIYRGAGGAGDAVADSSSEALLVRQLAVQTQASADAAATSEANALASKNAAATSATSASTSATSASTSATNASTSASSASTSASTATTQASAASTSATSAASSASSASASATTATTQASNASTSASAASTSATNASNSATTASTQASNAAASASSASTSATNAASSATSASGSASGAASSATSASTSATNAASSSTSAGTSASTATTQAGIATTQASNASSSASAASTSATNAAASATAASGSASTASTAATNASNSASAASTSASNAATSATNAANSATTAASYTPSQTGNSGKFLTTNGTSTSWGTAVTSVTGTAGRVTSTGGSTPVIDLASGIATAGITGSSTLIPVVTVDTYGRVTSVTTASNPQGTVTSVAATVPSFLSVAGSPVTSIGTLAISYSGTALPVANGGTGLTSVTSGYIPYGNGTSALSTGSGLYYSGSLLGVGTSSPASVAGNAVVIYDSASPRLRLTSSTTGQATTDGAEVSLLATTNQLVIENRENADTLFYNNGTNTATLSTAGKLTTAGPVYAANGSTGGFYSTTFATNSVNNIWSFGNATGYGLKYFQGTAGSTVGAGNADTIAMPFGQTTANASFFQFISNGSTLSALVMPGQPRFSAGIAATSDATFNSGSYIPFNSTVFNDGSYSTSNYYFTAPVAGKYMFYFNIFFTGSAGSTYQMQVGPTLNGSFINTPSGDAMGCLSFNPTVAVGEFTGTMIINMAVGDVVGIKPRSSSIRVYQGHCSFGGYLIG